MNILLWVLQVVLAFLYVAGGYYKAFQFEDLARQFTAIPHGGWRALGAIEMIGAVLLVVPAAMDWMPILTPIAAGALAVETLGLSVLYAQASRKVSAENPLVWSAVMATMIVVVAYGRFSLVP